MLLVVLPVTYLEEVLLGIVNSIVMILTGSLQCWWVAVSRHSQCHTWTWP